MAAPRGLESRLLARLDRSGDCWVWQGAINPTPVPGRGGYGVIGVQGSRTGLVHRVAYALWVGSIPEGLFVLHHCDNRLCANPDHLYAGTAMQNTKDMKDRDREAIGERCGAAKLTPRLVETAFALRARGWTQREIGRRIGVTQSAVSRVLSGNVWAKARAQAKGATAVWKRGGSKPADANDTLIPYELPD